MSPSISTPTESATTISPLPPRYSSLTGALSPESSQMLRSLSTTSVRQNANVAYPPRYSNEFSQQSVNAESSLSYVHSRNGPSSSGLGRGGSAGLQPFEYHIKSGNVNKTQPWATLKVFSRSPSSLGSNSSSVKFPKFTSKDPVQGCLELNLESPQNVNSISLSLRGKIASQFEDGCYFLDHPVINWTRTNGDPRAPPDAASSRLPTVKKFDGKLSGSYVWPFFLQFPSEVTAIQDGEQQKYPTPQTFVERGTNVTIQYSLVLKMTHGMLRTDSKLQAGIVYVPDVTPPAFSILRQLAYLHSTKIPGPEADPLGWNALPPAVVFGKLGKSHPVKLECSLSIANPLTYTRGTFIPVHLTIRCSNTQALKALAKPSEITVRLTRRLQYYQNATQLGELEGATVETVSLEQAVWQETDASIEAQEDMYIKHLEGEIHLRKDLQPSCGFRWLNVSYAIELLPFNDSILKASTLGSSEILLSHPVTIVTQRSIGLAPIPSTTRLNLRGESSRPRPRTIIRPNHQVLPYFVSYDLMVPAV